MSIVTISRQIGSYGQEIGKQVAGQLGYRFIWRDLINKAARQAGAPAVALAMIDELHLLGICPTPRECQKYIEVVNQILCEIADQDNVVIVGRAGQCILANYPNCLHTRITAPEEVRAQRIAEKHGISIRAATEHVKASDRYRRNYLRRFHHIQWDDPALYDLNINTQRIPKEEAVAMICDHIKKREKRPLNSHQDEERNIE
jgi:cytidylate kinase